MKTQRKLFVVVQHLYSYNGFLCSFEDGKYLRNKTRAEKKGGIRMFQKKFRYMAAVLAALMITQGSFTAFADEIGPGYDEQNKASTDTSVTDPANAWKKVNGVYVDNNGKTIEGALLRGISVAKWQGDIDWAKVAADDISFAFIKMMSYGYEGGYTMDPNYEKNMKGALDNGVQAAPYVYLQTKTVEEAKAAAKYAVEKVSGYNVKYPIAVDVESKYILELSVQELTDVVNAFCDTIVAAGYTPIVYSDYSKFTTEMDTKQIHYDIWLARYGADGTYEGRTIWQCTDKGHVNGINGNVCLEFAYKDYAPKATKGTAVDTGEWKNESGKWYFYRDGGRMSGWINPDGYWYYLDPSELGAMVTGTTMTIDGVSYTFDANGVMQ